MTVTYIDYAGRLRGNLAAFQDAIDRESTMLSAARVIDAGPRLMASNRAFLRTFGLQPQGGYATYLHPEDACSLNVMRSLMRARKGVAMSLRIRAPGWDFSYRWVIAMASPVMSRRCELLAYIAAIYPIADAEHPDTVFQRVLGLDRPWNERPAN